MNASFERQFDSNVDSQPDSPFDSQPGAGDEVAFARSALSGLETAARAGVVNRTHRVVRHRAKVMQARRSRVRSLTPALIICSVLLFLTCLAVWTGFDQYQAAEAAEAVQADVNAMAAMEASNHFLVVLLWFVPVSMAVLAIVWYRRPREGAGDEVQR